MFQVFRESIDFFVLSFENYAYWRSYERYFLPALETKDYNVMIDEEKSSKQPVKNYLITFENIQKIGTSQGDDYTTGCLLDYNYFKNYYKMIAMDLSKQQELEAD